MSLIEDDGVISKLKVRDSRSEGRRRETSNQIGFFYSPIIRLKASPTITNRKGDRGSPCLKPLLARKKPLGVPLTRIENHEEDTLESKKSICHQNVYAEAYKQGSLNLPFHKLFPNLVCIEGLEIYLWQRGHHLESDDPIQRLPEDKR